MVVDGPELPCVVLQISDLGFHIIGIVDCLVDSPSRSRITTRSAQIGSRGSGGYTDNEGVIIGEASHLIERKLKRSYRRLQGQPWKFSSFEHSLPNCAQRRAENIPYRLSPSQTLCTASGVPRLSPRAPLVFGAGLLGASVGLLHATARQMQT